MKRILVMALGVLMLAGAATAQPYWTLLDALNAQEQWLDSLATLLSAPTPDWVTVTDGYHTAAASSYAFLPLQPLGDYNTISLQATWATSDTLFYQILCSNSMMDSLTALNQGTAAAPIYTVALLKSSYKAGSEALKAAWSPTGSYGPSIYIPGDYGRFAGVRVFTNSQALTSLKLVLGFSKRIVFGGVIE